MVTVGEETKRYTLCGTVVENVRGAPLESIYWLKGKAAGTRVAPPSDERTQ